MISANFRFGLAVGAVAFHISCAAGSLFERQVALEVESVSTTAITDGSSLEFAIRDLPPRDFVMRKLDRGSKIYRGQIVAVPAQRTLKMASMRGVKITLTGPAELYVEAVYEGGEAYWLNAGTAYVENADGGRIVQLFHTTGIAGSYGGSFSARVDPQNDSLTIHSKSGAVFADKRLWVKHGSNRVGYYIREQLAPAQTFNTASTTDKPSETNLESDAQVDSLIQKVAGVHDTSDRSKEAHFAWHQAFWLARGLKQNKSAFDFRDRMVAAGEKDPFVLLSIWQRSGAKCTELGDVDCANTAYEAALAQVEIAFPDGLHPRVLQTRKELARFGGKGETKYGAPDFAKTTARLNYLYWNGVDEPIRLLSRPEPKFPREMREWGVDGDVIIEANVDANGLLTDLKVTQSPHPLAESASLQSLLKAKFSPSMLDGKPVAGKVMVPFSFRFQDDATGSRIQGRPEESSPSFFFPKPSPPGMPESLKYDEPPRLLLLPALVYPRDLLMTGARGSATAVVLIDETGQVMTVKVKEATHPDFGAAMKAMLQGWKLSPAKKAGKPTKTAFNFKQEFNLRERDTGVNSRTRELLSALASNGANVVSIDELESRPKALYRPPPVDPRVGPQPVEEVTVEFYIDPDGLVQLPKAINPNNEELGWAAATALKRWIYEAPNQQGRPVFVRHRLAFSFR